MGRPKRVEQFAPGEIAIVHCIQRCVRRAFLAGVDPVSGKDYSFRREWIRRRMEALASVFGCEILSYSIMSNHLHLILRSRPDVVEAWTDSEVAVRWLKVYPGRRLEEHLGEPTQSDVDALVRDEDRLNEIRLRLSNISWFMRSLCEPIARMANKQDETTGRFWEGRFKALRFTDEAGLLAGSMYVDLNPIRAAIANSPDEAIHTSAYDRIQSAKGREIKAAAFDLKTITTDKAGEIIRTHTSKQLKSRKAAKRRNRVEKKIKRDAWLARLTLSKNKLASDAQVSRSGVRASDKGFLNIELHDYLSLLRWTARRRDIGEKKPIPKSVRKVVDRLGIDAEMWRELVWNFKRYFGRSGCAGKPENMAKHAQSRDRNWSHGQKKVMECFL